VDGVNTQLLHCTGQRARAALPAGLARAAELRVPRHALRPGGTHPWMESTPNCCTAPLSKAVRFECLGRAAVLSDRGTDGCFGTAR
jgi:hypothetical protein